MKCILGLLLGIALILGSGLMHPILTDRRIPENRHPLPAEETPPWITLTTVAFGGFRGLVADALWLRATDLQEEGEFFEMVQLSQWIAQLEPRVPEVWTYQAWNLAYNISALYPDGEDRWRWIRHGIDLLKNEGRRYNPESAELAWEIGWMYQHKIGMSFDAHHLFYKRQLAESVADVLPNGQLPTAPGTPLLAEEIHQAFHMDVKSMYRIEDTFGPLDWRLPETHSLYWAEQGLTLTTDRTRENMLYRMKIQSLASLIRAGELRQDPVSGQSITLPRLDRIPVILQWVESMWQNEPDRLLFREGTKDVLLVSAFLLAEYGEIREAVQMVQRLADLESTVPSDRESAQRFLENYLTQHPSQLDRNQAMARVVALLRNSLDPSLSDIRARGRERLAQQVHRLYQESRKNEAHLQRTGLPPFDLMKQMLTPQEM